MQIEEAISQAAGKPLVQHALDGLLHIHLDACIIAGQPFYTISLQVNHLAPYYNHAYRELKDAIDSLRGVPGYLPDNWQVNDSEHEKQLTQCVSAIKKDTANLGKIKKTIWLGI